jgi:hypothetical protein
VGVFRGEFGQKEANNSLFKFAGCL